MEVKIKRKYPYVQIPQYATQGSAGADLRAEREIKIYPGDTELVPIGIYLEIPKGYEGQIRPRSGLAKHGLVVANTPGTIDSDYRGEVMVMLRNNHTDPWVVREGDRIAQIVFAPVEQAKFLEVGDLVDTKRGEGGFGSTGVK